MKTKSQYRAHPGRTLALWGLIAALALVLGVGDVGIAAQGSGDLECLLGVGQRLGWGDVSLAKAAIADPPHQDRSLDPVQPASLPLADEPPANPPTASVRTVTYTYDRSGRLASASYGGGVLLVYGYDPSGNLRRVTDHFDSFLSLVTR